MNMLSPAPPSLASRPHFEILDGLRGIAAVAVVIFHFMEMVEMDYAKSFIGHGYLAVDFFFCLSGFVVAYAYDQRIALMGKAAFFRNRFIRLHPMIVMGAVLGLIGFFCDPYHLHGNDVRNYSLPLVFLSTLFLLPYPVMNDKLFNLFGLNAPAWSLFWEYMANIVYALVLWRLSRRWLWTLTILAAAALFYTAWNRTALFGGWDGKTFWDGGARLSFSFLAGMLVYRSGWRIPNRLGFAGVGLLCALIFLIPFNSSWTWLVDPLVAVFYHPFLICLGVGSTLPAWQKKICRFSGDISYPLYMIHYWVIWIFADYMITRKPATPEVVAVITAGTLLLIGLAWLILKWYDEPVRNWLRNRSAARLALKKGVEV